MEPEHREHVSSAINFFWGEGTTSPEAVNPAMASIAYEALEEAQYCSASMDFVPRPTSGPPGGK